MHTVPTLCHALQPLGLLRVPATETARRPSRRMHHTPFKALPVPSCLMRSNDLTTSRSGLQQPRQHAHHLSQQLIAPCAVKLSPAERFWLQLKTAKKPN
eukprot:scaffold52712_cov21-Tisochrysis_lutea.AAC.3